MKLVTFKVARDSRSLSFNTITGYYGYKILCVLEEPTLAVIAVALENKIMGVRV